MLANPLVQCLAVAALGHRFHENIFRGHERQFAGHVLLDDLRMNHEPIGDVGHQPQHAVGSQESLGQRQPAIDAIVQRSFQPLSGGGLGGIGGQGHHKARQPAHALGAHGIALVSHGRRADLLRFKRFFDFALVSQQTKVRSKLVGRLSDAG